MVNVFTNDIAREADVVPAYAPYPVPDLSNGPWIPNETSIGIGIKGFLPISYFPRTEACLFNVAVGKTGLRSAHPMNMQAFTY